MRGELSYQLFFPLCYTIHRFTKAPTVRFTWVVLNRLFSSDVSLCMRKKVNQMTGFRVGKLVVGWDRRLTVADSDWQ